MPFAHPQGGLLTRGGLRRGVHELAQLYRTSDLFQQVRAWEGVVCGRSVYGPD